MSDNPYEPDLTEDELDLLRRAGASDALIQVAKFDTADLDAPVERNSVLAECKKYVRGAGGDPWLTEENVNDFNHLGGHFFSEMWDGNLYDAWSRADGNNRPILKAVFGVSAINRQRPAGYPEVEA